MSRRMPLYLAARVHSRRPGQPRVHFPPQEIWLLGLPRVGHRMALLTTDGHRSMLTSRIQRVLHASTDVLWVETAGSIYELRLGTPSAKPDPQRLLVTAPGTDHPAQ